MRNNIALFYRPGDILLTKTSLSKEDKKYHRTVILNNFFLLVLPIDEYSIQISIHHYYEDELKLIARKIT